MLVDAAKPVALALCMVALYAMFWAVLLGPAGDLGQSLGGGLELLSLAAGICFASGMLFRESADGAAEPLVRTLPVQMFLWAVSVMAVIFLAARFLETHCIFYRDLRRF